MIKLIRLLLSLILLITFSACGTTEYKAIKLPDIKPIPVTLKTNMSGGLDRKNTLKAFVAITAYRQTVTVYNDFKKAIYDARVE